jgi:hypothetical protein
VRLDGGYVSSLVGARVSRTIDCTTASALRARWSTSHQQRLAVLGFLAFGDVDRDPLIRTMRLLRSTLAAATPMRSAIRRSDE